MCVCGAIHPYLPLEYGCEIGIGICIKSIEHNEKRNIPTSKWVWMFVICATHSGYFFATSFCWFFLYPASFTFIPCAFESTIDLNEYVCVCVCVGVQYKISSYIVRANGWLLLILFRPFHQTLVGRKAWNRFHKSDTLRYSTNGRIATSTVINSIAKYYYFMGVGSGGQRGQ